MINIVKTYFKNREWQFTQATNKNTFFIGFGSSNGTFQTILELLNDQSLTFFSIFGSDTPQDKKNTILILLNLINNDRFLGNFEMNPESGEIRYKTCLSLKFIQLNPEILDEVIVRNITTMDKFIPAIKDVLFNEKSPFEAYTSTLSK